ncbi:hypothetical protein KH172YL63_06910 [Bacillus sp. KH172YL63]|nr:hypothetical protein KH172YL63_06910 [Bacillus sp. KH172YL63]
MVKGFIGQIGGWSHADPLTACIYAFWESRKDYDSFMEDVHDEIFDDSGQGNTYTSIDVQLFDGESGENEKDLLGVLKHSAFMLAILSEGLKGKPGESLVPQPFFRSGEADAKLVGVSSSLHTAKAFKLVLTGWTDEASWLQEVDGCEHFSEGCRLEEEWRVLRKRV